MEGVDKKEVPALSNLTVLFLIRHLANALKKTRNAGIKEPAGVTPQRAFQSNWK